MPVPDPLLGLSLHDGEYTILERIGTGGMGAVYKVRQSAMNRLVALKVLHPKYVTRKEVLTRFRREARILSQLTHPHTLRVFDTGLLDDGRPYIVMELLEGRSLHRVIRTEAPLDPVRIAWIVAQAAYAIEEAHQAGVLHRDIKPENIFMQRLPGDLEVPKVLDFGLAKLDECILPPGSGAITKQGAVFGTPEFMSPEQARGEVVGPASDVYALGVVLYEGLCARLPFDASSPLEWVALHSRGKPIPIEERAPGRAFPVAILRIVERSLAKNAADRFPSARAFGDALLAFCERPNDPLADTAPDVAEARTTLDVNARELQRYPSAAPTRGFAGPRASASRATAYSALPERRVLVGLALAFLLLGAALAFVCMKLLGGTS